MAVMGKYCKAYSLKKLREFSNWTEKAENARPTEAEEQTSPRQLTDGDYLYLQENYVVTDGIFKDEHIIFDDVTPEWIEYCQKMLEFEIPDYASTEAESSASDA
jgi:hypothetical protein